MASNPAGQYAGSYILSALLYGPGRAMSDDELTQQDVLALAGTFSVAKAKALLFQAGFPSQAIPETGFTNSYEFWVRIAEQIAAGVMPDGRRQILIEARRIFPYSKTIPEPPPADMSVAAAADTRADQSRPGVSVDGSRGTQIGSDNVQVNNYFAPEPSPVTQWHDRDTGPPAASQLQTAALRVLVIGASPVGPDLPPVRADREAHAIEKVAVPARVAVKVVLGAEATDVQRVGSFRPDIVHFVCHGTADSLVLCDIRGESHFVKAAHVAELLAFYRDTAGVRLRGIVLAACDGGFLAPFFTGVGETVIAHQGRLSDPCGVAFAEQLYTRLNSVTDLSGLALVAVAREAAQLTAQYSAACEPMIANLITMTGG
jgi:hypothetical protein